jgi:hypothetical protein
MSGYLIDKVEDIAERLKEIESDRDVARTGTSAPVQESVQKTELPYGYGDYCALRAQTYSTHEELKSLGHPNWPYAGSGFEWRKFVRS